MQPIYVTGKHSTALIYAQSIDQAAQKQIQMICNSKISQDQKIRIMPDVHAGANCVIGFTQTLGRYIVPDLIGTDIGCGVCAQQICFKLENVQANQPLRQKFFSELDQFVHKNIPCQRQTQQINEQMIQQAFRELYQDKYNYKQFKTDIGLLAEKFKIFEFQSIGTLGGGNHFIEIDEGQSLWIVVHSGSREIGKRVAEYYTVLSSEFDYNPDEILSQLKLGQKVQVAQSYQNDFTNILQKLGKSGKKLQENVEFVKMKSQMPFLVGPLAEQYIKDMKIAQQFASLNRKIMLMQINQFCKKFQQENNIGNADKSQEFQFVESVHNYIDFDDKIIRKGAIRSYLNEPLIIPLNMKDGVIVGYGKSNEEWNYSAPHGAGRQLRRSDVEKQVTMQQFQSDMQGVYTTCVAQGTLDECPRAYKDAGQILENIQQSVTVCEKLQSVYNFKAGGEGE